MSRSHSSHSSLVVAVGSQTPSTQQRPGPADDDELEDDELEDDELEDDELEDDELEDDEPQHSQALRSVRVALLMIPAIPAPIFSSLSRLAGRLHSLHS
jgi:hypothetical protein